MPGPLEEPAPGGVGMPGGAGFGASVAPPAEIDAHPPVSTIAVGASVPASSPMDHPAVVSMRRFLLKRRAGTAGEVTASLGTVAVAAHRAAECGRLGDQGGAAPRASELEGQLDELDERSGLHEAELAAIWDAIAADGEEASNAYHMDLEDVEELVLAHLCVYPEILAQDLVRAPIRQVALGQNMLNREDRRLNTVEVERHMAARFPHHQELVTRISSEACEHLQQRSETIAAKLLRRLDLNGDGVVSRSEFLRAAPHSLAIEIENVVLTAGVQTLLNDPDYADDFHMAMGTAMGLDKDASGGGA